MRNNAGQQSSPVFVMRCGVGSVGGHVVVYNVAFEVDLFSHAFVPFGCA